MFLQHANLIYRLSLFKKIIHLFFNYWWYWADEYKHNNTAACGFSFISYIKYAYNYLNKLLFNCQFLYWWWPPISHCTNRIHWLDSSIILSPENFKKRREIRRTWLRHLRKKKERQRWLERRLRPVISALIWAATWLTSFIEAHEGSSHGCRATHVVLRSERDDGVELDVTNRLPIVWEY